MARREKRAVSQLALAAGVEPTACLLRLPRYAGRAVRRELESGEFAAIALPEVTQERRLTAGAERLRDACRQLMAQEEGVRTRDESPPLIA